MRVCRICLRIDLTNSYINCFDNNAQIAREIFNLFNLHVVELQDVPASICRICEKHVLQAVELKKTFINSNNYFRDTLSNERYLWHENLRELKALSSMVPPVEQDQPETVTNEARDTNSVEFDDFMNEADDLMQSMQHIECEIDLSLESSKSSFADSDEKEFETDPAFSKEDSQDEPSVSNFEFIDMLNITEAQIIEMTEAISKILPADKTGLAEKMEKDYKTPRRSSKRLSVQSSVIENGDLTTCEPPAKKQPTSATKSVYKTKCEMCSTFFKNKNSYLLHMQRAHRPSDMDKRKWKNYLNT